MQSEQDSDEETAAHLNTDSVKLYRYEEFREAFIATKNSQKGRSNLYCTACEDEFSLKFLSVHLVTKHANSPRYLCSYCDEGFYVRRDRVRHVLAEHMDNFKCDLCNYQLENCQEYASHMRQAHSENVAIRKEIDVSLERMRFQLIPPGSSSKHVGVKFFEDSSHNKHCKQNEHKTHQQIYDDESARFLRGEKENYSVFQESDEESEFEGFEKVDNEFPFLLTKYNVNPQSCEPVELSTKVDDNMLPLKKARLHNKNKMQQKSSGSRKPEESRAQQQEKVICGRCGKGFKWTVELKYHYCQTNILIKKEKPNFTCGICHETFDLNFKLNRHIASCNLKLKISET